MPASATTPVKWGGKARDLHTYLMTVTTVTTRPAGAVTETVTEFVYTQALLEIGTRELLMESTVLSVVSRSGDQKMHLQVPPSERIALLRSGGSLQAGQVGAPVVFPEGAIAPGQQWEGLANCALVTRGPQQDMVRPVALPVSFELLTMAHDVLEIEVKAPELTVEDNQILSLQGNLKFSLELGCILSAVQTTVQSSADGNRVDTTTHWAKTQTLRAGE